MDGIISEVDHNRPRLIANGIYLCIVAGLAGLFMCGAMLWKRHQHPVLDVPPERINPNTAALGSLVRLPNIGVARASDIIAYRRQYGTGQDVFRSPADLEKIHGIGPKTVEALQPWLTFQTNNQ